MFAGLEQGPVANFFGPVIEVSELAVKIVNLVGEGRGGTIAEPAYARWIGVLDMLPDGAKKVVREAAGVDKAMRQARVVPAAPSEKR